MAIDGVDDVVEPIFIQKHLRQQLFHPVDRAVVTLVDLKMQKEPVGMGGVFPDVPMQHPTMFDDPAGMKNSCFSIVSN